MSILSTIVIYLVVKLPIHFTAQLKCKKHFSLFSCLILINVHLGNITVDQIIVLSSQSQLMQ